MEVGAKIGDVVVFPDNKNNRDWMRDITYGKEYTIVGSDVDYDDVEVTFFIDDAGDKNYGASDDGDAIFEVVA